MTCMILTVRQKAFSTMPGQDLVDNTLFVEWIVENYKTFGAKLKFITDRSQEGNQFCKGFGAPPTRRLHSAALCRDTSVRCHAMPHCSPPGRRA